ncbi:hypothetical protein DLREEDagrD3_16590 [Denitratisoma sp. agr-D3]
MTRYLPAALLLPVVLLCWGLGDFGLLNNVEGMYAEIGREMLQSSAWQDWVIPHLNGLPYIEKPPLLYWAIAASLHLFGVADWAVRLVPVAAGLLCLGAVYAYGRQVAGPRFGFLAAFLLGTSAGFVMMSKVAMTDALLSALLTSALLLARLALLRGQRRLLWLGMAALALAVLTKGLVALALYGLVWLGWLLSAGRAQWRDHLAFLAAPSAWGVFLGVAAPWHLVAAWTLPEFSWFYFINEHVLRFLGLRVPKDYYSGTPFYYLPRLALMALPWWPGAVLAGWLRLAPEQRRERAFLWACVLAPLVFFSASSAKANYYILVCLPGLALLAAQAVDYAWARQPGRVQAAVLLLGCALVPAVVWLLAYAARTETAFSARTMAARIQAEARGEQGALPLFLYQDFEDYSALPFYLQQPLGVVDQQSADLRFGLGLVPRDEARYPTLAEFLHRPTPALLLVLDARVRNGLPPALAPRLERLARVGNASLYRFIPASP